MDKDSSKAPDEQALFAGEAWFDPIEAGLRGFCQISRQRAWLAGWAAAGRLPAC